VSITDDSEFKLVGATELGIHTVHFTSVAALEAQLHAFGVGA
jgi:hypothetical protein